MILLRRPLCLVLGRWQCNHPWTISRMIPEQPRENGYRRHVCLALGGRQRYAPSPLIMMYRLKMDFREIRFAVEWVESSLSTNLTDVPAFSAMGLSRSADNASREIFPNAFTQHRGETKG